MAVQIMQVPLTLKVFQIISITQIIHRIKRPMLISHCLPQERVHHAHPCHRQIQQQQCYHLLRRQQQWRQQL